MIFRTSRTIVAAIIAIFTFSVIVPCFAQNGRVIENLEVTIEKINGDVEVKFIGQKAYVAGEIGMKLHKGDYIATGFESECIIRFEKVATMSVKQMTNFAIAQFFYDGNLAKTAINLRMGEITTSVKPEKGVKASFNIITPTSTVGVRGTENTVTADPGFGTDVFGISGTTQVSSIDTGKSQAVTRNDQVSINEEQKFTTSFEMVINNEIVVADYGLTDDETKAIVIINPNLGVPQEDIKEIIADRPSTSTLELYWNLEGLR